MKARPGLFGGETKADEAPTIDLNELAPRLGSLLWRTISVRRARQCRTAERKAAIDRMHDLSVSRQESVLNISRGSVYYVARSVGNADLSLMRPVYELHLDYPFSRSRMLQGLPKQKGH